MADHKLISIEWRLPLQCYRLFGLYRHPSFSLSDYLAYLANTFVRSHPSQSR